MMKIVDYPSNLQSLFGVCPVAMLSNRQLSLFICDWPISVQKLSTYCPDNRLSSVMEITSVKKYM